MLTHEQFALIDRYAAAQTRLTQLAERMHHNLAEQTDLDGLERLVAVLERVALSGDRVEVTTAQAIGAKLRAAAAGAGDVSGAMPATPPGVAAGGEIVADLASISGEEGVPTSDAEQRPGREPGNEAASTGSAVTSAASDGPAAGTPVVVLKQQPPVSKPGRKRGWQGSRPDGAGEGDGE
jgi:hypothetical protein